MLADLKSIGMHWNILGEPFRRFIAQESDCHSHWVRYTAPIRQTQTQTKLDNHE